jgi:hypothetical protein
MKKLVLLAFALVLALSLVACGGNGNDDPLNRPNDTSSSGGNNSTNPPASNGGDTTPSGNNGGDSNQGGGFNNTYDNDWPENEYTKLVPRPDFEVEYCDDEVNGISAKYINTTMESVKAYASQLKAAGFTVDPQESEYDGQYVYGAGKGKAYFVTISYMGEGDSLFSLVTWN